MAEKDELKVGDRVKNPFLFGNMIGTIISIETEPVYLVVWDEGKGTISYTDEYKSNELKKAEDATTS